MPDGSSQPGPGLGAPQAPRVIETCDWRTIYDGGEADTAGNRGAGLRGPHLEVRSRNVANLRQGLAHIEWGEKSFSLEDRVFYYPIRP